MWPASMKNRTALKALLMAMTVFAAVAPGFGCSSDEDDATTSSPSSTSGDTGGGGRGGDGAQGGTGNTGNTGNQGGGGGETGGGGSGGDGGVGGSGGSMMTDFGPPVSESVNAGEVSASTNYKMVFTLGQPAPAQGTMTSPSYRLQGGLVGAMGSLP